MFQSQLKNLANQMLVRMWAQLLGVYTDTSTLERCRAAFTKGDNTLPSDLSNAPRTHSLEKHVHTCTSRCIQRGRSHWCSRRQGTKLWFIHIIENHTVRWQPCGQRVREGRHKQGHAKDPINVKFKSSQDNTLNLRDAHLVKATQRSRDRVTPQIRGVSTAGVGIQRVMGSSRMLSCLPSAWHGAVFAPLTIQHPDVHFATFLCMYTWHFRVK